MTTFGTDPSAQRDSTPPASTYQGDGPRPFLSQPRAESALRHELAGIAARLAPELERRRAGEPDSMFEMHIVPHRLIARLGDAGLSFSWVVAVGCEGATVSEGRLLVIQWTGVATERRGVAALRSARPVRERVYRPEGVDAEHWRWRIDDAGAADGEAYTTDNLVAEWLATSSLPSGGE